MTVPIVEHPVRALPMILAFDFAVLSTGSHLSSVDVLNNVSGAMFIEQIGVCQKTLICTAGVVRILVVVKFQRIDRDFH